MSSIQVQLAGTAVRIDGGVFTMLLDNSVAGTYADYRRAQESGTIKLDALIKLAERGEVPFPLFFAPSPLVEAQLATKTKKLLAGISKTTFSLGARNVVALRDVELIVKDLLRKQEMLKSYDNTLARNDIVGILSKPGASFESDAVRLLSALGMTQTTLTECRNRARALETLIDHLEAHQILVSRSVQNFMPQRLTHVRFSGMTIRDNKVPFIFLAGGDHGDYQEPVGRTIFTLTLMAVLIACKIFAPVTWDGQSIGTGFGREYEIAGAMLVPADRLRMQAPSSLDDIKTASEEFMVTPSAMTVRALRLGLIDHETANLYLRALRIEFEQRSESRVRSSIKAVNAVRKYNGREFSYRMLNALDAGKLSPGEFCRTVCLNHLGPAQIDDLRKALK